MSACLLRLLYFANCSLLVVANPGPLAAQSEADSLKKENASLRLSAFAELFHVIDFNKPPGKYRQPFLYNHNRHLHPDLNLAVMKVVWAQPSFRANLAIQEGTYVRDNYAAEPPFVRHFSEASAGVALDPKRRFWMDAGILPSHIGFESAVSLDNATLTRSLLAENSPYYMAGARLSYSSDARFEVALHLLNGWQRIRRVSGNSMPSFGTQVISRPSEYLTLNWSTFIGTDDPDSTRRIRYFNNFYLQTDLTDKCAIIAGFDVGFQQQSKGTRRHDHWYSPVFIFRYAVSDHWRVASRAEYYHDPEGVIAKAALADGLRAGSISLNTDYSPFKDLSIRIESRWMFSREEIFLKENGASRRNFILAGSVAYRFSSELKRKASK